MGFGKVSICLGFWLVAAMTVWPASSVRGQTGSESSVGYIDSAIPRTQLRLRVDAVYNDNRPDRVDFFYAKYAFLGGPGPPLAEKRADYQKIDPGLEYALSDRFSIFRGFPHPADQSPLQRQQRGFRGHGCRLQIRLDRL